MLICVGRGRTGRIRPTDQTVNGMIFNIPIICKYDGYLLFLHILFSILNSDYYGGFSA